MSKKKKKKKIKHKGRFIAFVAVCLLAAGFLASVIILRNINSRTAEVKTREGWIASDGSMVQLYHGEETVEKNIFGKITERTIEFSDDIAVPRGTAVTVIEQPEYDESGELIYEKLSIEGTVYFVKPGSIVDDYSKVITETEKYVRTPVTVYKYADAPDVAGLIKKGNRVDIIGFDKIDEKGGVEMYKVNCGGTEGYVFSKYLVDTQEEADAKYNESFTVNGNTYTTTEYHSDLDYLWLYGGSGANLDYYPVEKPSFEGNTLVQDARTMYISIGCIWNIDGYIECAKQYGVNAFCIDIYDGVLSYPADTARELAPTVYANANQDYDAFASAVQKAKDAGIYVMGRIVCFKNDSYAKDHPEHCIDYYGTNWPSIYSRGAWEYNIKLAIESVRKFGFNEIQLDYVRFPENAYTMSDSGVADFKNAYGEEKCDTVQAFVIYACDMIHREGAYLSVDVFGESSFGYMPAYGQYWPAISNVVDAISGMPYVDHFEHNIASRWEDPYTTVYNWAFGANKLQQTIPTPAVARTWITGWDTPYWGPYMTCDANYIAQQARGLWDAGLTGGFLTWGQCELWRYQSFSWAWGNTY
ncbi:MAG: hypothetical protein IJJ48_01425 [Firmicutes bacterium]|nr:hypothetical protein [Bacillota bacterium]